MISVMSYLSYGLLNDMKHIMITGRQCKFQIILFIFYIKFAFGGFMITSSFATQQYTSTSHTKLYADKDDNNSCTIGTSKLTTKSGKQVCRYALGGAARSTQPKSLPRLDQRILSHE